MLKGLGQLGDMAKIMKQAQEMQSRMGDMQARLDTIEVEGEAGASFGQDHRHRQGRGQAAVDRSRACSFRTSAGGRGT